MKTFKKTFSNQLKEKRTAAGLSQTKCVLAIPLLNLRTLQAWECGQQQPPLLTQMLVLERLSQLKPRRKS
jgi:transcriptional regulator with XRE-family HTH domain